MHTFACVGGFLKFSVRAKRGASSSLCARERSIHLLHYDELPFNDARASACLISQISLHLALSTSSLCQMLCAPIISVNSRCNFCFYQAGVLRISSCTALGCSLKWRGRLRGGGTVKLDGYRAGTTTKHTSCSPDAFTISASVRIYIHMGFA